MVQRIFRLLVGLAAIALFDRDAVAWGWEATAIVLAIVIVYALVGVAVRRRAPAHRAG